MKQKRISFGQGKGSLTHNNRIFIAKNVETDRIKNNVTFISQPIAEAYEQLFGKSQERYNTRQKRNDRKIHGTYYENLFHQKPSNSVVTAADKRKSFYEGVVQIGKMEDSGIGTEDAGLVAECLKEYMQEFQTRNPNFYVFNAVLHMDEATPHLHIDYIPVAHHTRGMDIQNGIAKALEEMGFGKGKTAIAKWRESEIEILNQICLEHGIEPLPPEKSRGTVSVAEYKEQRRLSEEIGEENKKLSAELSETRKTLESVSKKKAKLIEIDNIETGKTVFGGKVTISKEDYDNLSALAKKQVAGTKQNKKLKSENTELLKKVSELESQVNQLSTELEQYKKPLTFSREKMKEQAKEISEREQLRSKLKKAFAVIDKYELRDEYEHIKTAQAKQVEIE